MKIIGKRKAIELLMETAEVEQNGGLFIVVRNLRCSGFVGGEAHNTHNLENIYVGPLHSFHIGQVLTQFHGLPLP